MGLNTWNAVRLSKVGPDGRLNYDQISDMAIYLGHMKNSLSATSHGGATTHAYGEKVHYDSYGLDYDKIIIDDQIKRKHSIVKVAQGAGKSVGIINSGTITEPGTGAFVASVKKRSNHDEIAKQILESDAEVIFGGGEKYFLPKGKKGYHGSGVRKDGVNLIKSAKEQGYIVIYNKDQLLNLPKDTKKVLGLFASNHTFNDESEDYLQRKNLPLFTQDAPTIAQMTKAALEILSQNKKGFLLIAEEEGTDNFGNYENATGVIESGIRADNAIGEIISFIDQNPNSTLITTSDSDAGGMQVLGYRKDKQFKKSFKKSKPKYDGINSTKKPFIAKQDQFGNKLPFLVLWTGRMDVGGGILVKSYGKNSGLIRGVFDNTEIYDFIVSNI